MSKPSWLLPDETLEPWPNGPLDGGFEAHVVRRPPARPFGVLLHEGRVLAGPTALGTLRAKTPPAGPALLADLCCHLVDPTGAGRWAWRTGDAVPAGIDLPIHPPRIVGDQLVYWRWTHAEDDLLLVTIDLENNLLATIDSGRQLTARNKSGR